MVTSTEALRAAFFNNSEIHFMLFDKDLNVIDVNEAALKFYHVGRNQVVGKNIIEIAPDAKEKGLYDKYKRVIQTGQPVIISDIISHPQYGNQHNRIKAFKVGEGLGAAAINITELKNTIDSLELFILQSSHDLRSPIASIIGLASIALKEKEDVELIKDYCSSIRQQADRIDTLIQSLVETVRVRRKDNESEHVKFGPLIEEVKKSIAHFDGFNEVHFTTNILARDGIYSDRACLVSLFQNLIDNAIKYRSRDLDSPQVKITVADDVAGVKITITDNGVGIPEDMQKNVFKMFFRGTNAKNSIGLGLYTVFHVVKRLNGHITFFSKPGIGTTFTVYLPCEEKTVLIPSQSELNNQ